MSVEPQIKYALTEDGVSIAYWTVGEGTPFIWPHGALGSSSLRAWRTPEGRALFERLASRRMIVRYDARGFANSQEGAADFSLEARVRDLAAVVDRLGAQKVDLCGYLDSGPGVIAYAAAHPERVSHLVLWGTGPRGIEFLTPEVGALMNELARLDFDLWREAMVVAVMRAMGVGRDERTYARTLVEGMTPQTAAAFVSGVPTVIEQLDVSHLLADVRTPTLILHRRELTHPRMGDVQTIAARIANARLVILEGDAAVPYMGDVEPVVAAIAEFLGGGAPTDIHHGAKTVPGGLVTILFTDLVGHTAMMQRLGDERGRAVLREHERITRELLKEHGGAEVKTMGDGFMASFGSVTSAMECAIALQRAFAAREGEPLQVRVGLNAGEPIEEDGDLFGATVILASRIAAMAGAGGILIPEPLRHLLAGKSYEYADRGETMLKGFEDAVRLYEVRWRE